MPEVLACGPIADSAQSPAAGRAAGNMDGNVLCCGWLGGRDVLNLSIYPTGPDTRGSLQAWEHAGSRLTVCPQHLII